MTGKIFISYRRTDESGHAGRLFDALQQTFGADRLFIDVASLEPGLDASSNSRIDSLKFVSGAVAVVLLAVWAFSMGLEFPSWHAPQPENPPIVVRVCKSEQASDCPPYDIAVGCKDPNTGVDDIRDTCKSLKVKQTFTGSGGSCGVNVFAFTCLPK